MKCYGRARQFNLLVFLLLSILLSACTGFASSTNNGGKSKTVTVSSGSSNMHITYSTKAQDVLLRTFYGGGIYGSLELAPDISLYGDGTYILGQDRAGKLDGDTLHQLLNTIVGTYRLLDLKRKQFADVQDQNATFLEITVDGKRNEYMYGSFGYQKESTQDLDEYKRLNNVLTTITDTLKGPTHPYKGNSVALLVRQTFDQVQAPLEWSVPDFHLDQAADYECGILPEDTTSLNHESGCLKYLIPQHAILLNSLQLQKLRAQLRGQQQGVFTDEGLNYTVILRPLLPDELSRKNLAMFGSAQSSITDVRLLDGAVPPLPTPTPST